MVLVISMVLITFMVLVISMVIVTIRVHQYL